MRNVEPPAVSKRVRSPLDSPWRSLIVFTVALLAWTWWFGARWLAEVERWRRECAPYDIGDCLEFDASAGYALTFGHLAPLAIGTVLLGVIVLTILGVCLWRLHKRRQLPPPPPMPT